MLSRRTLVGSGFAALALGLLSRKAGALGRVFIPPCEPTGAAGLFSTSPFLAVERVPRVIRVGGLPFAEGWTGDWFDNEHIPFHHNENLFPGGAPPEPQEDTDIAIVGGGLSGLASAHLLRAHRPVLFELQPRFGGTSMGEVWRGTPYSLGSAYFIAPDEGSFLQRFYRTLGLNFLKRESPPTDDINELRGRIEPGYWDGDASRPEERGAFREYRALVQRYVDQYPEIPLDPAADNQWIRDLDAISLRDHITDELSGPIPDDLAAGIQGYCYSSFNAAWDRVSAASGWNFIAAEEFGRWVLPGGNAGLAAAMWASLLPLEARTRPGCPPRHLRAGCRVVDVRRADAERMLVTWRGSDGEFRSLRARRVVMACPKHVCRHVLHKMDELDPGKFNDFATVHTNGYAVANILLDRPVRRDFYDLFLLRQGGFPDESGAEGFARAVDAVKGDFNRRGGPASVLTMYWPLPYPASRFTLIDAQAFTAFATGIAPELEVTLGLLGLERRDVKQIRLTRWGHAMPVARPGMIANGLCERIREPYLDNVFFVHQDNWALPAVETCLLEAEAMRPKIQRGL